MFPLVIETATNTITEYPFLFVNSTSTTDGTCGVNVRIGVFYNTLRLATLAEERDKLWIIDDRTLEPLHSTKSAKCDVNIGWIASLLYFSSLIYINKLVCKQS